MSEEENEFLKRTGAGAGASTGAGAGKHRGSGSAKRTGAGTGAGKHRGAGSAKGRGAGSGTGSGKAAAARKANIVTLPPSRAREFSGALAGLPDEVYVTIDMDVFDPSFVPSVGTPEPGGLSWQEVTGLMKELAAKKRVVAMDVNELRPIPGLVAPDFLAARLVYRLIGSFLRAGR